MKKVGIVTWYWKNYGSILQSYALQQVILGFGMDCEVINHRVNGRITERILCRITHNGVKQTAQYYVEKIQKKMSERFTEGVACRNQSFESFVSKNIVLSSRLYLNSNYRECKQYDIYICGSDQIWNPQLTFLHPFYWLGFVNRGIKISYAPSMGNELLKASDKRKVKEYLKSFDKISVREQASAELIAGLVGHTEIQTVVDPTMLISAEKWKEQLPKRSIKERYLFAYILRGNREQREFIASIAREYNLVLVVYPHLEGVCRNNDEESWGDIRCFDEDPFDFLEKINNAEIIITDSFHCSVFSILFHKDFYVLKKTEDLSVQFERLRHLLKMCLQEDRIIQKIGEFVPIVGNYGKTDEIIENMRRKSLGFLKSGLDIKNEESQVS